MKKYFLLAISSICFWHPCHAQSDVDKDNKNYDNYIGVQVNGLIRQIFSTATTSTGNPYLLNYSIDSRNTGWGFRIGLGYNHSLNSNSSGTGQTSNKADDIQLRAGIEKAFPLSKRLSAGAGVDGVFNYNNDYSNNTSFNYYDTTVNNTKTLLTTFGGGVMGWLRYNITNKIVIGTEASFYYAYGTKNLTVDANERILDPNSPTGYRYIPTETKNNFTVAQGNFSSPIVLFLMVKF